MRKGTVCIDTLGCKLNQAESEALSRELHRAGYQLVESSSQAEVYVLNTCTVTHIADRKARHLLRLARRQNPAARIIALGCYARRAPEELKQLGVAEILPTAAEKSPLLEMLGGEPGGTGEATGDFAPLWRTRAQVKIQDGCNAFCSFCIVPYVRGRERSIPPEEVVAEVKARVAAGCREVVLTGTNIGAYGRGLPGVDLKMLLQRLLAETRVERLRLSSLQPRDLTPEFLKLWSDDRLCRHLHLPLQSGCDSVLQRMRRRYSVAEYERAVLLAQEMIPGGAITTDILVGFPGESEEEFAESYNFCHRIGFAGIHVFPYSARCGTVAATLPFQVEERVKRARKEKMLQLAQRLAQSFRRRFLGQTVMVLWEKRNEPGIWSGLSDNYLRVLTRYQGDLTNRLLPARLIGEHKQGLWGEIVEEEKYG